MIDIDAIKARSADALRYNSHPSYLAGSASDVPALVAEVEQLRTSVRAHEDEDQRLRGILGRIAQRCPMTCPHGSRCTREDGHGDGCNHRLCDCNEPDRPVNEWARRATAAESALAAALERIAGLETCADYGHLDGGATCERCKRATR